MSAVIAGVDYKSPAYEAGIKPGDEILEINGIKINDYLDFMYASCQEEVSIKLSDRTVDIFNEDYLPLGISFETLLIDKPHSCRNKCVFCFIDQLPPGMRQTCYFKDDDYRLSFLQGNYVTLTNMTEDDVRRIIDYNLPRINISVHTTNPELRKKMLNNKFAGEVLKYLDMFAEGGLNMNAQIVLCPGYNDGAELDRTLSDLGAYGACMESVSVVPVGLSDYRDGLADLKLFDAESAAAVIMQTEKWQKRFIEKLGTRLVYLSDEFYIMANHPLPNYDDYEGFPQIENGVGLCTSLKYEFKEAIKLLGKKPVTKKTKTVPTGMLAYDLMTELCAMIDGDIRVVPVQNRFFGENITVTGLITGGDLVRTLERKELGDEVIISAAMLRHEEAVFLDDMTLDEAEERLGVKITPVANDGYELLEALLK